MNFTVIRAASLLNSHVKRWRDIQSGDSSLASPFFCPEFTMAVAAVRRDVWVAIIHDSGDIAGFFPFQRGRFGIGKPVGGPLSDYHGLICKNTVKVDVAELLKACSLNTWDFNHLPKTQSQLLPYVQRESVSHIMDVSDGYAGYTAKTIENGTHVVKKNEKSIRKMKREKGDPAIVHGSRDISALQLLFDLKSTQYTLSGLQNVFSYQWTRQLLQFILTQDTDSFSGMLTILSVEGEVAAVHMGMRSRYVWHWWFPAHKSEFARYSPGIMLRLDAAKIASSVGVRYIDLGKGDTAHKMRLRTGTIDLCEGSVERNTWTSRVRHLRNVGEAWTRRSCLFQVMKYPGRLITKLERRSRFR